MKKHLMFPVVIFVAASIAVVSFCCSADSSRAAKAEQHGKYLEAQQLYIQEILKLTEPMAYPQKEAAVTASEGEWKQVIERYMAWINFSVTDTRQEYTKALSGILRCSSFVEQENFVTLHQPKALDRDLLAKQWNEAFVRSRMVDLKEQQSLIDRALQDSMSVLRIRALNGYIYKLKLLDGLTGKRVDFILYPNNTIIFLVKPRNYYLICGSEVQYTDGLKGKTWNSSENVIALSIASQPTLQWLTLKTQVRRIP